ncbi:MAG: twin-arginine translocase TatA/TatE family subunit [Candidatus Azambacteria bacterium]|nr:twin-arginine translocase TatA/TatE family subunit [Candidatus Azambacteria bacterium]
MFGLGTREIIILAGILVLLFGAKRIPVLVRSIGEAIGIIRKSFSDEEKGDKTDKNS